MLNKINQIIDKLGDVIDVKQFSDISMSLRIENRGAKNGKTLFRLKKLY